MDNDIQKAMWFAIGAAITAVATAYQTYQSNKRSSDEREFALKKDLIDREYADNKSKREKAESMRIKAYESFIQRCTEAMTENFSDEAMNKMLCASSHLHLVASKTVADISRQSIPITKEIRKVLKSDSPDKRERLDTLSGDLGAFLAMTTAAMRDDLGQCGINLARD